jgi:hypothetical protein
MRLRARDDQRVAHKQPTRARLHRDIDLTDPEALRPPDNGCRRRVDVTTNNLARFGV